MTYSSYFTPIIRALSPAIFLIITAVAYQPHAFADNHQIAPPNSPHAQKYPPHMQMEHRQRHNNSLQIKQQIDWQGLSAKSKEVLHPLNGNWNLIPVNIQHFLQRISTNWDHIPTHRQNKIRTKIKKISNMSEDQLKVLEQRRKHMKGLDPKQRRKLIQQRRKFSDLKHEERMQLKNRWDNFSDDDKKYIQSRRHAMRSICNSISKLEGLEFKPNDFSTNSIPSQLKDELINIVKVDASIPPRLKHKFMQALSDWGNTPEHKKERIVHLVNKCAKN